jgi:hypothetical protein
MYHETTGTTVYVFDFSSARTIRAGKNLTIQTDPNGFMTAYQG